MTNKDGQPVDAINQTIRQMVHDLRRALIVAHIRPDGDAVGSLLGLGLALIQAGKDVRMVLVDGVPRSLQHLEGAQLVHRSTGDLNSYDHIIVVDCSDLLRVGSTASGAPLLGQRAPDLNIDHHITNLDFAHTNLVIPQQVATCAIIAEYLTNWGLSYNSPIASALLTGIVTDTIGFRTSNVTSEALRLAAMLMDHGADLPDLYSRALTSKSFEAARYWGQGLGKLHRQDLPGGSASLVWTTLTLADREAAQYPGNDDADLVNLLSSIDSDVAVIFVEQKNNHTKVSWRARPGIDVAQIALQFGGGGHAAAAGADIPGTLEMVQGKVLEATQAMLAQTAAKNGHNAKPVED